MNVLNGEVTAFSASSPLSTAQSIKIKQKAVTMAKKFENAFAMFNATETKTAKIEALGGAEIEYRELTMAEQDAFSKRIVKSYGADGKSPEIDFEEANKIKYEKAALVLITPAMTVDDLMGLPASAADAINEINALVDPEVNSSDEMDKEGN